MTKIYYAAFAFLFSIGTASAQITPELLKDLNVSVIPNSNPFGFVRASSSIYFIANEDFGQGNFPYVTDGTAAGTQKISGGGFTKGLTATLAGNGAAPFNDDLILMDYTTLYKIGRSGVTELMTGFSTKTFDKLNQYTAFQLNGKLFFWADNGTTGVELYVTDGTAAGTSLFMDFSTTRGSSNPGAQKCYFKYKDRVYFLVIVEGDMDVWRTDGTVANTTKVATLLKGITGDFVKFPFNQLVNGKIFIAGAGQFLDPETDVLTPLSSSSTPQLMENSYRLMNDKLYYLALVNGPGPVKYKINVSDGTGAVSVVSEEVVAGTYVVPNFITTSKTDVDGKCIFVGKQVDGDQNYTIWATDGTAEGSVILNSSLAKNGPAPTRMYCCGDKVYIQFGNALWVTDGTPEGTMEAIADPGNTAPNYYMDERSGRMYMAYKEKSNPGIEPYFFECGSGVKMSTDKITAEEKGQITVYPNPVTGQTLYFNGELNGQMQLFYTNGSLLFSAMVNGNTNQIEIPQLTPGVYMVRISGNSGNQITKLIVQ